MIASTTQSVPFIQAGSIRALAQSGKTRTSTLADVPAIAESYPGFEAYAWWGVFAPAGTPKAIVSRFADELAASLREPGVAKQLNETQQVTFALAARKSFGSSSASRCECGARSRANTTSKRIRSLKMNKLTRRSILFGAALAAFAARAQS